MFNNEKQSDAIIIGTFIFLRPSDICHTRNKIERMSLLNK